MIAAGDPLVIEVVYCSIDYQALSGLQDTFLTSADPYQPCRTSTSDSGLRDQVGISLHFYLHGELIPLGESGECSELT